MLNKFNDKVWMAQQPLKFLGVELGARMTIIDVGEKELLIHSPIEPTKELVNEINRIGTVKHIVAPNLFHHLFAGKFKEKYPKATLYCVPGLEKKRSDIKFDEILREGKDYPWSGAIQHHLVQGSPMCNEVIFFLSEHKTLLVTDLGLHICENSPLLTRMAFKSIGMFKKFGWSKLEKLLFIRDNKLFAKSAQKILKLDFDKIILSHGNLVESNGHELFKKAFA